MKIREMPITQFQQDRVFAPIRTKKDLIERLIYITKQFLIGPQTNSVDGSPRVLLCKGKMSRVFAFAKDRYITFHFPFAVTEDEGQIKFSHWAIERVDNRVTSIVMDLIHEDSFNTSGAQSFVEPVIEQESDFPGIWELYKDLLTFEDGYLRYDYDSERQNGRLHPLNHLDIFYTSNSSFKLGIDKRISEEKLQDLLNVETDCGYVQLG
ncbi:hypothetical protein [Marinobacter mangrovi]|uniref:hypothetical protein n=1 Tax=Marinobacter mangrovi TaxID=2803918 RepID=UPI00193280B4|nr:hypothetical protein [Marinobacter mangrovi]